MCYLLKIIGIYDNGIARKQETFEQLIAIVQPIPSADAAAEAFRQIVTKLLEL